jgi:TRAP-type C4-dicarboxylate transport system substrate-binding protein
MKYGLVALAAAAGLSVSAPVPSRADEPIHLKLPMNAPLTSPVYVRSTHPWIEQIEKEAGGTLKIDTYPGGQLASPTNIYDRLVNNVFELAYGIHGSLGNLFPRTSVAELPFLATEGTHSSVALWNMIADGTIASEYAQVKPLAVFVYPQAQVHTSKPVHTMEDLKGLKIATSSKLGGDVLEALGATPINVPPPDLYSTLNRHMVNGSLMMWTGVVQFKLLEVTSYHLETMLGSSTGFVLMNKPAYARLPDKAKKAFDDTTGRVLSARYGRELDGIAADQRKEVGAMPGHQVIELPPAEMARWREKAASVYDEWVARTPDGAKILAAWKAELKKAGAM